MQPFRRFDFIIHIAVSALPCNHFQLSQVKHMSVQAHNIETMSQYWEGRNTIFLWKCETTRQAVTLEKLRYSSDRYDTSSNFQTSNFRLQGSDFRVRTSDFRIRTSEFRPGISELRLQTSSVQTSEFRFQTLEFRFQDVKVQTSKLIFQTTHFKSRH